MKLKEIVMRLRDALFRRPAEPPRLPDVQVLQHPPLAMAMSRKRRSAAVRGRAESRTRQVMKERASLWAGDRDFGALVDALIPGDHHHDR